MTKFTHSVPIIEELGQFDVMVSKVEYPVKLALVRIKDICLDTENPRLMFEDIEKGKPNRRNQKQLQDILTGEDSKKYKKSAESLRNSMEHHGGQNEAIWVQFKGGKTVALEGNRRRAIAKTLNWDTMLCQIYPDQMPPEHVQDLLAQRHVGKIEHWDSSVRSKVAYDMYVERELPLEEVCALLQFKTTQECKKYIDAYVWWEKSGLPRNHWSKFHHAVVPTLMKQFGYDSVNLRFDPDKREKPKKGPENLEPSEIDQAIAKAAKDAKMISTAEMKDFKADFSWFVKLIENGSLTDCRQSDSVVAKAVREIDEPHGHRVMALLCQKSSRKLAVHSDDEDGKGKLDHNSPAQQASDYLRSVRNENHIQQKVHALDDAITSVLGSKIKLNVYKNPPENSSLDSGLLKADLGVLIAKLIKFEKELPPSFSSGLGT